MDGTNTYMPVMPAGYGAGDFGGASGWWIILLFLFMGFGGGFGGFGGNNAAAFAIKRVRERENVRISVLSFWSMQSSACTPLRIFVLPSK